MSQALREDGRPVDVPAQSFDNDDYEDEVLDDSTVEQILDPTPDLHPDAPVVDAALGIRNALIGGIVFWAILATAYLALR
jgi:hypothetical protein